MGKWSVAWKAGRQAFRAPEEPAMPVVGPLYAWPMWQEGSIVRTTALDRERAGRLLDLYFEAGVFHRLGIDTDELGRRKALADLEAPTHGDLHELFKDLKSPREAGIDLGLLGVDPIPHRNADKLFLDVDNEAARSLDNVLKLDFRGIQGAKVVLQYNAGSDVAWVEVDDGKAPGYAGGVKGYDGPVLKARHDRTDGTVSFFEEGLGAGSGRKSTITVHVPDALRDRGAIDWEARSAGEELPVRLRVSVVSCLETEARTQTTSPRGWLQLDAGVDTGQELRVSDSGVDLRLAMTGGHANIWGTLHNLRARLSGKARMSPYVHIMPCGLMELETTGNADAQIHIGNPTPGSSYDVLARGSSSVKVMDPGFDGSDVRLRRTAGATIGPSFAFEVTYNEVKVITEEQAKAEPVGQRAPKAVQTRAPELRGFPGGKSGGSLGLPGAQPSSPVDGHTRVSEAKGVGRTA